MEAHALPRGIDDPPLEFIEARLPDDMDIAVGKRGLFTDPAVEVERLAIADEAPVPADRREIDRRIEERDRDSGRGVDAFPRQFGLVGENDARLLRHDGAVARPPDRAMHEKCIVRNPREQFDETFVTQHGCLL